MGLGGAQVLLKLVARGRMPATSCRRLLVSKTYVRVVSPPGVHTV